MTIHFICRGNVMRSLVADAYLKSLRLKDIIVTSSGTIADADNEKEQAYFTSTLALLKRHGIEAYAKAKPERLTQQRADNQDITICMNQIVVDEANKLVTLPANTENWQITDIGEGDRILKDGNRLPYEEMIYAEITGKVGHLVQQYKMERL